MGAHYGSVQVWSKDYKHVLAVAEQVARDLQIRMLVGPELNGWIGLYPEGNGQDQRVGHAVAELLDGYVLTLLVHDDDIFAYWFFNSGEIVDSYWSVPGYFGDEELEEQKRMAGNAAIFHPVAHYNVEELSQILERGEGLPTFASQQLERFAKVLGIANVLAAYEYMKDGEVDGILKWNCFSEVPQDDVAAEKRRRKLERERIKLEWQSLKNSGVLVCHEESQDHSSYHCRYRDGFLVMGSSSFSTGGDSFYVYQTPWRKPVAKVLEYPVHPTVICSHDEQNMVAIAGREQLRIWNTSRENWTILKDIKQPFISRHMCISTDGQQICRTYNAEVWINDINSGRCTLNHSLECGSQSAIHPDGKWLAVASTTLGICQLDAKTPWCDLYIGGKVERLISGGVPVLDSAEIQKWEADVWTNFDKNIQDAQKFGIGMGPMTLTEDQISETRQAIEKVIEEFKRKRQNIGQPVERRAPIGKEAVCSIGFSRDGKWLWCGTSNGVRVYPWSQVPRESDAALPEAKWIFLTGGERANRCYIACDIAEEINGTGIVFGGHTGQIYRMDLLTGQTDVLLNLPGRHWIIRLVFSSDGKSLGVTMQTAPPADVTERDKTQKGHWMIFDYAKLHSRTTSLCD